jgi:hypothetical protein
MKRVLSFMMVMWVCFIVFALRAEGQPPEIRQSEYRQEPFSPLGPLSQRTGLLLKDEITKHLIQISSGDLAHD